MPPETRYAKSGDVNIAYQVVGDGPFAFVYVPGGVSNIDLIWEKPATSPASPTVASGELKGVGSWRLYSVLDA